MSERRSMTLGVWFNSAVNVIVGFLLGLAAHGLAELSVAGFWVSAILIVIPFIALVVFVQVFDGMFDRIFPTGIRPARAPTASERKPLALVFSLPAGFVLGVTAAIGGLGDTILGAL